MLLFYGVIISIMIVVFVILLTDIATAQPAAPAGVRVVRESIKGPTTPLAQRVYEACAALIRNPSAGILYTAPYSAAETDRVCVQQADGETIKCQTVRDMRSALGADPAK